MSQPSAPAPHRRAVLAALLALFALPLDAMAAPKSLTDEEAQELVRKMEENTTFSNGVKMLSLISETFGKTKVVREVVVYQRNRGLSSVMLVSRPKTQAGNGFLRVDRNIWSYAASTGKWERRTERDQFAGTNMRGSDFGGGMFVNNYTAKDGGEEKVGEVMTRKLILTAKPDVDAPFPQVTLWLDSDLMAIKRQDFALSGKLMRTTHITKQKVEPGDGSPAVWAPQQLRMQDEVDKDRITTVLFQSFDFTPFDGSVFTKAWLESKSR